MVAAGDRVLMARALFLAERGRGRTTPNPVVGAVVTAADGTILGQGAHLEAGGPHAEVVALEAAGPRAAGGTLHVTLEPCAHTGRTGPCTERIVAAGVRRVVAAVADPDPRVSGRGIQALRARGIAVDVGVEEEAARRQNAPFFLWLARARPLVLAKTAVSADGFVGRRDRRVPLSDPAADRWLHRQRAAVDALAVGAGTVLVDDPRLTPRGAFRWRPLTRVVCDWRWRVRPTARVFSTTGAGPVIMVGLDAALRTNVAHRRALEAAGAEILALPSRDLGLVLDELGRREVQWLLVEGGPELHEAFFAAGLVDRAQRIASPVALGDGVPQAPAFARLATCARPDAELRLGADVLTEWDVHRAH